jgi:selenide,water dikinase
VSQTSKPDEIVNRGASPLSPRIVLIGAGHTNLHVVRMWMQRPIANATLTLISPFAVATYSGMLPGTLAGLYTPDKMEIDLYRLTRAAGAELIVDEAVSLNETRKEIQFRERPAIAYDLVSIGAGSVPRQMETLATHPGFVPIKPMFSALQRLDSAVQAFSSQPLRIAIIGGGAAGVEVALCTEHRIRNSGGQPEMTLVDANSRILSGFRNRTIRLVESELQQRGISLRCGSRVIGHAGLDLLFDHGEALTTDVVIWVTGACPPNLLQGIHLPKSKAGFLRVQNTLQSVGDPSIFVVGDSAEIDGADIDRAGVYAVRQGPILFNNLVRCVDGRELVNYKPQQDFLRLLATGDGRAIVQWKWFSGIGAHWWKLKNHIDSEFMNMHRPSAAMLPAVRQEAAAAMSSARTESNNSKMRCRGCGGKTSARVLQRVLQRLRTEWPSASTGFLQSDDTAILPDTAAGHVGSHAVSVDFFPAFLTDPWLSGRIAAIHALSDLWASGVRPTSALAMVTLPEGSLDRQTELLHHVLNGAVRELSATNTVLVGGHTTNGEELAIGFTVFGRTESEASDQLPLSKANLRPGQLIVLTKALGTGVILAANSSGQSDPRSMSAAIETMLQSNQRAGEIACECGVVAATDVTGFGLAGHLLEMCQQSRVSIELNIDSVPLIRGTAELIQAGVQSSLFDENKAAVEDFVILDRNHDALYDPQTSGGLLLGVARDHAAEILMKLKTAGYREAAIIGRVNDGPDDSTAIRITVKTDSFTNFRS